MGIALRARALVFGRPRCEDCNRVMRGSQGCTRSNLRFGDGEVIRRNVTYFDRNLHCHDCGIANHWGNVHHFGCDVERCPRCDGQLISCDCKVIDTQA